MVDYLANRLGFRSWVTWEAGMDTAVANFFDSVSKWQPYDRSTIRYIGETIASLETLYYFIKDNEANFHGIDRQNLVKHTRLGLRLFYSLNPEVRNKVMQNAVTLFQHVVENPPH